MFQKVYTVKENAVQKVRELYLGGSSLREIRDFIKSESLIQKEAFGIIGWFVVECFCLEPKYVKLMQNLFLLSPTNRDDYEYLLNKWNQRIRKLIEESKPKWNVIDNSDS